MDYRDGPPPRGPDELPRTQAGFVNNCAVANGQLERLCQVCEGKCPDRERFKVEGTRHLLFYGEGDPVGAQAAAAREAPREEEAEQRAGERAFAEAAGLVEVTWGEELFKPLDYNGIRLGPFKATTAVRPGETVADAVVRLHAELAEAAKRVFGEKRRVYLQELSLLVRDARNTEIPR